jgi:hypothetical protein
MSLFESVFVYPRFEKRERQLYKEIIILPIYYDCATTTFYSFLWLKVATDICLPYGRSFFFFIITYGSDDNIDYTI